ncbi:MAG TPA: double-strand break repair helicase AddA [Stellaceae bacterium]|jgi:ATP-dependent helicase/nuclease subunit A
MSELTPDSLLADPGLQQRRAYEREASVWVEASAGTGKTTVLTRRVLSLLLAKTAPSRILCLTFTKAAAAEMANRINETLARWATSEDGALAQELVELIGEMPDADQLDYARQLFARVLDAPGGITIATIHAFCQSLLRRFPIEAGVAPHFEVMDERSSAEALTAAREAVLTRAREERTSPLAEALAEAVQRTHEERFTELLGALAQERARLFEALGRGFDEFARALRRLLDLRDGETLTGILAEACRTCDEAALRAACEAMRASKAKTDQERGAIIAAWFAAPDTRHAAFDDYLGAFFTADGTGPRYSRCVTVALAREQPAVQAAIEAEAERLQAIRQRRCAAEIYAATLAIARLGAAMLEAYERHKTNRALLDYDDLVLKARDLLRRPGIAPWVLFKLDGGLDHILVDEAQDTNPEQWEIVQLVAEEFFAGEGTRDGARTVFAVGDAKQSIYSFQRADPAKFIAMRLHFERAAGEWWRRVPLHVSFRSVAAILAAVDAVFAGDPAHDGVMLDGQIIRHIAQRHGDGGLVELWPPIEPEKPVPPAPWEPPLKQRGASEPRARLAQAIAARIRDWLDRGERLEAHDRPIRPSDIMVLVRRRGPFVGELVRHLKKLGVPVAGVDRMILTEQLAVEDMMALAQFLLLPEDDLTLASVLKGPLFGLSEDELYRLAWLRPGSLWASLREHREESPKFAQAADELSALLARVDFVPPYELFAEVLSARGGRKAILGRLGPEASDPLDELLAAALAYERAHGVSLQGFLHWLAEGAAEIKRDLDQGARNEVRILTVHGAKGLEAPIVFLPDTLQMPTKTPPILWHGSAHHAAALPLWMVARAAPPRAAQAALDAAKRKRDQEYRRLLYVAMTRAADRLYICGWQTKRSPPIGNWHALAAAGLRAAGAEPFDFASEKFAGVAAWGGDGLRLRHVQKGKPQRAKPAKQKPASSPLLPDWCSLPPPPEPAPPKPLAPSQPQGQEPAARSPLGDDRGAAFLRGRLVHRLLQSLPAVEPLWRVAAAQRFLALPVHGLATADQHAILDETMAVLNHPEFAPLFGPGSVAEVPVVGLIGGRALSGQIDRLVIEGSSVLIVDYKTIRPVPADLDAVPPLYFEQLAAYRAAIAAVFRDKEVRCALLWTDGPTLMPVPPAKLMQS